MADQQLSAPPRVPSGIRHVNHDHRRGYVKIGNHLAQHRELSMAAIGLATHIQSLPTGAKVTIKALADRFPEGEVRIATALRELERHGYLARLRERLPSGHVVTCTISYNNPPAMAEAARERLVAPRRSEPGPTPRPVPDRAPEPEPEPNRSPNRDRSPNRRRIRSLIHSWRQRQRPERGPVPSPNPPCPESSRRHGSSSRGCACVIRGSCCPSATRYGWRPQRPSGWSAG